MPINPTARYNAPQSPVYRPSTMDIYSITNANPATVVTTFDGIVPGNHNYSSGLIVRLIIPKNWGMAQANQLQGTITVLSSSSFLIDIDTTTFDVFSAPSLQPGFNYTAAQVIPVGETNDQLAQAVKNILPPLSSQ